MRTWTPSGPASFAPGCLRETPSTSNGTRRAGIAKSRAARAGRQAAFQGHRASASRYAVGNIAQLDLLQASGDAFIADVNASRPTPTWRTRGPASLGSGRSLVESTNERNAAAMILLPVRGIAEPLWPSSLRPAHACGRRAEAVAPHSGKVEVGRGDGHGRPTSRSSMSCRAAPPAIALPRFRARVNGVVLKRLFDEEAKVRTGQPLFPDRPGSLQGGTRQRKGHPSRAQQIGSSRGCRRRGRAN